MVDLATALSAGFLATFIPLYAGIFFPTSVVKMWRNREATIFLAAASAGTIFWFFLDVMGDAVLLDVNQGFSGNIALANRETQAVLVALFALGLVTLVALERRFSDKPQLSTAPPSEALSPKIGITYAVAAVVALGIGFHALGEGMDIGSSIPAASTILDAIGGVLPGIAYLTHKFLEGIVVGVFALIAASTYPRKLGILGLISGVPTLIGFFLGAWSPFSVGADVFNPLNIAFFFALGGSAALYIEMKLIPLFVRSRPNYSLLVAMLVGFYSMYFAGLFHG